jgi:hypothetical protein
MTNLERHALIKVVAQQEIPHVTLAEYVLANGMNSRTDPRSIQESDRLLKSEDFRDGWSACHEAMKELITFVITADAADLRRFAGRPPKVGRTG